MIGGLALFLYGMNIMGNGLSKMAGSRLEGILEKLLEKLTKKKLFTVLLGAGVTAVIQSSSAVTVMVVGFVNSGIMKLCQAAGIIMGANIGTTITSWMLSLTGIQGDNFILTMLKPSTFSPLLAGAGILLVMAVKVDSKKGDIGSILLGFAILMFGMETMSSSVSGLSDNPTFTSLMTAFSNPILGMIAGAVLTAVIQSSSASVGILQALCATGAISFSVALPIIMGQNIGTCITSIISSIGANTNAKRAAMVHLYFNLIGTTVFMLLFYGFNAFIDFAFLDESANAAGIAVIHSFFNIGATMLLYPASNLLVKLATLTIRDKTAGEETQKDSISIDERFLAKPSFAMEICKNRAAEMAELSKKATELSLDTLVSYDTEKAAEVKRLEALVDKYEDVLGSYLVKLSGNTLSKADSRSMSIILHSISDFERISDHALNTVESAEEIHGKGLSFSEPAKVELNKLSRAVNDILSLTVESACTNDLEKARHIEPLEQAIDALSKMIKKNHIKRLQSGICSIEMGFILEDILIGLERVSDHCSNIAVEMITIFDDNFSTHKYFTSFSDDEQAVFNREYEGFLKKYNVIDMGYDKPELQS